MEKFIASLISGVLMLFGQKKLNEDVWDKQNEYNELMYQKYNSPTAQSQELKKAGLSDSAIGQALSGYNGQSLDITSSPLQPANIMESLSGVAGLNNDEARLKLEEKNTESNVKLNKALIEKYGVEAGLTGKQLDYWTDAFQELVKQPWFENQKIAADIYRLEGETWKLNTDAMLNDLEYKYKIKFNEESLKHIDLLNQELEKNIEKIASDIGLNEVQKKYLAANIAYLYCEAAAITQLDDVRKKDAAEARYYMDLLEKSGKPYDVKLNRWKIGTDILNSVIKAAGLAVGFGKLGFKPNPIGFKTY